MKNKKFKKKWINFEGGKGFNFKWLIDGIKLMEYEPFLTFKLRNELYLNWNYEINNDADIENFEDASYNIKI